MQNYIMDTLRFKVKINLKEKYYYDSRYCASIYFILQLELIELF